MLTGEYLCYLLRLALGNEHCAVRSLRSNRLYFLQDLLLNEVYFCNKTLHIEFLEYWLLNCTGS